MQRTLQRHSHTQHHHRHRQQGCITGPFIPILRIISSLQADAVALIAKTLTVIAPFRQQDNKARDWASLDHSHGQFAVVVPPKFAVVVEKPDKVSVIWLSGGLDEWLEFRNSMLVRVNISNSRSAVLHAQLGITPK